MCGAEMQSFLPLTEKRNKLLTLEWGEGREWRGVRRKEEMMCESELTEKVASGECVVGPLRSVLINYCYFFILIKILFYFFLFG